MKPCNFPTRSLALIAGAWLFQAAAWAEPVALPPPFNDVGKSNNLDRQELVESIPSKSKVGIPVYPGAMFASTFAGEGMLPAVQFISADEPEKVTEWYRDNLKGWNWSDIMVMFYNSDGDYDFSMMGKVETVAILEETGVALDLMFYEVPDVKTRIQISYQPKQ